MKRIILALTGLLFSTLAAANTGSVPYHFDPQVDNLASIQRGARDFMAYCSGCHSLGYLRYNRMADDLGIPEDLLKQDLMFTSDKPGDHILSAMPADSSKGWFGQTPPDLTLESRARGADWLYSYLLTFYLDPSRPNGVNNLMLPGVSMPNVLWELQGWQVHAPDAAHGAAEAGGEGHAAVPLTLVQPGQMSPEEYQKFVGDIVNFLAYAAEPGKAKRISTGYKAMLYLLVLFVFAYFLKKEFWKDVH